MREPIRSEVVEPIRFETLNFDEDGVIEVKGRFTKDDKATKDRSGNSHGKEYHIKLSEGETYTITYQFVESDEKPNMRILGDLGFGNSRIKWDRRNPSVAMATVNARNRIYSIVCYCPADELVEYTLVIRRQ